MDKETFLKILDKDFVDIYIYEDYFLLKNFSTQKKFKFKQKEKMSKIIKTINQINEENGLNMHIDYGKENFSFYIKKEDFDDFGNKMEYYQGFRALYGEEIKGEYINLRKLSQPKSIDNFIKDPILKKFFAQSFLHNKGLIVSGPTGSGKTTLLVSFLHFINSEDTNSYRLKKKKEFIESQQNINLNIKDVENYFNNLSEEKKNNFEYNLREDVLYKALNYVEKENKKIIFSIENPIEFYFLDNKMHFIQNDIALHGGENTIKDKIKTDDKISDIYKNILSHISNIYINGIEYIHGKNLVEQRNLFNKSLRTNPDYLYIGEVRDEVEFDGFLKSISLGIPTFTSTHADDTITTIQRIYDTSSLSHLEKVNLISSNLYGVVNTRIFWSESLKQAISFFDVLFLNDSTTRLELYNNLTEGQLHKFQEKLEDKGVKNDENNKQITVYLNKKSSLLFSLMDTYFKNRKFLEDDKSIFNKFVDELKFLFDRYQITELDYQKFTTYYHPYKQDDEIFEVFKDFLKQNNILLMY